MRLTWLLLSLMIIGPSALGDALLAESLLANREYLYELQEFRSHTGEGNNLDPTRLYWGSSNSMILRFPVTSYPDGKGQPFDCGRECRLNPRVISNNVLFDPDPKSSELVDSPLGISDFFWLWGQFIDHDVVLTPVDKVGNGRSKEGREPFPILVPVGDPAFDPQGSGFEELPFSRSKFRIHDGLRFQINENTAFVDASVVYGSDEKRANALRARLPDGRLSPYLAMSRGPHRDYPLLPYNTVGVANDPDNNPRFRQDHFFMAGDVRANEQVALTALHTVFAREHNYLVQLIEHTLAANGLPALSPQKLYHLARMVVGAELQVITYRDFLPLLLGKGAVPNYVGYNPEINPGILSTFSTAAFRFGHTMLPPKLLLADWTMRPRAQISVRDVFFEKVPDLLRAGTMDDFLRGAARQTAQNIDVIISDDVRNFLFGIPEIPSIVAKHLKIPKGLDLPSLNIQRGRDHGIPRYNEARRFYKLPPVRTFAEITSDPAVQKRLASVYSNVEEIDTWVGGLAEDHAPGALVGPLFQAAILEQFLRLRDGDRFWYQKQLPGFLRTWVEHQSITTILRRNTKIGKEFPSNAFAVGS